MAELLYPFGNRTIATLLLLFQLYSNCLCFYVRKASRTCAFSHDSVLHNRVLVHFPMVEYFPLSNIILVPFPMMEYLASTLCNGCRGGGGGGSMILYYNWEIQFLHCLCSNEDISTG